MSSTITGNVGGASFSGALVQALNVRSKAVSYSVADGSGNYSLTGLAQGDYDISATYPAYKYYVGQRISADGTTTYSAINLHPTAISASNNQPY